MTPYYESTKVARMDSPFIDILLADTGSSWDRISDKTGILCHRADFWPSESSISRQDAESSLVSGELVQPMDPSLFGIRLANIDFAAEMEKMNLAGDLEKERISHAGKFITYLDQGTELH